LVNPYLKEISPIRPDLLKKREAKGIRTFAMIAPILPGAEGLVDNLRGKVDYVMVDRLNYRYANRIYRENKMEWALEEPFFIQKSEELKQGFEGEAIPLEVLF
jgi:hypothetical protein